MEPTVYRFAIFSGLILAMGWLELRYPRLTRPEKRSKRWPVNGTMTLLNVVLARLTFASLPYSYATFISSYGYGFIPQLGLWKPFSVFLGWFLLEGVIYWQHRLFHKYTFLWKLHQVHHSDRDLDFTSGVRFHPLEILLSLIIKMAVIGPLGVDPMSFLIFEVSLNAGSMFNHANVAIPKKVDRWLRLFIVTPDMHRIHHGVEATQHQSNFTFTFSIFDRLFGSYQEIPFEDQGKIKIGLTEYQPPEKLGVIRLLLMPFR